MGAFELRRPITLPAEPRAWRRCHARYIGAMLAATLMALPASAAPRGLRPPRPLLRAHTASQSRRAAAVDSVGRPGPACVVASNVLSYHGGDLVANADVFLLFWGAEWQSDTEHIAAAQDVITLYQQIGMAGYACSWNEYSLLNQPVGPSRYHGAEVIASEPPSPVPDQLIHELIMAEVDAGRAPAPTDDTVYVVLPPRGVPVDVGGQTGCGGSRFVFCGYHDSFQRTPNAAARFRYAVLPFPCDASQGTCFVDGTGNAGRSLQEVGSHELAELVTDPDAPPVGLSGWLSDRTGDENADICTSAACDADIQAGQQTLLVNSLWSNLAKGCIDSVPCSPPTVECSDASPGACTPGRGAAGGCALEWLVYPNLALQATDDLPGASVTCGDGQPFCDFDNAQDGQCTFHVAACLSSDDPRVPCTSAAVNSVKLSSPLPTSRNATNSTNAQTILTALSSVDPHATGTVTGAKVSYSPAASTPNACTSFFNVVVPVRLSGSRKLSGRRTISPLLGTDGGRGSNRLKLVCSPSFP